MPVPKNRSIKMHATTVRLPECLYAQATAALEAGHLDVASFNDFVVDSLKEKLHSIKEASIDAQFAKMRFDEKYRTLAAQVAEDFAGSDWETLNAKE